MFTFHDKFSHWNIKQITHEYKKNSLMYLCWALFINRKHGAYSDWGELRNKLDCFSFAVKNGAAYHENTPKLTKWNFPHLKTSTWLRKCYFTIACNFSSSNHLETVPTLVSPSPSLWVQDVGGAGTEGLRWRELEPQLQAGSLSKTIGICGAQLLLVSGWSETVLAVDQLKGHWGRSS